ncbi:uncharacterized protein LOC113650479 isoform X11 [Tachysurus fulvidraco]|uniref:uncharacterized protein LOC113650479 isoform X11 n=1 Tax=Tachysurus fulvidraco TaxID=1234273 RepID=UPI001FEDC6E3|nr:uncharacterized protein LOC113650479 isoform X11 [Tachysurus fulvidraco]
MASSNVSAKEYVRNARENLVGRLQNLPVIVEKLHQQNVFNGNEVSEIEAEPEKYNKTRRILDWVLNKGEKACYKFLRILDRERKLVLPKPDSTSQTPDLHTWISLFSFRDEDEDDYIKGPVSCHQLQNDLKTRTKQILLRRWSQSLRFYGGRLQKNFTFIPLVLDTETENNTPRNKITLKSKKSKKSRSKKMKSYIPKDTQTKSPEDLVNSSEKSILIVGKPGIGKTTVVQQMLHHWAERSDRNLDFMFYFDENTLTNISTTESLENLLLSKYLMSNPQLKENAEEILQYLQEYSDSVTIVFDGIRDFQENTVLLEIKDHDLLPEAKIVVTCRPEVEYEFSDWTTCKVYVKGFSGESIYDFFKMMTVNEPELVDIVINNPALFSLCHVPMYALMVAACISYYTSEEAQKHFTATELYVRIFRHCLQRHGNKTLLYLDGHIKDCRDMVLSLAESAFNATKLKTINLEFDYDERGISGAFLKTVSVVSPACAKTFCAFSHNTMQEFFSALWLLEKSEILDEVLRLCQNEDSEHMKHIIPFLCGIQSQTITDDLKCLFPLNKLKDNIDGFFEKVLNTFFGEQPDDENTDIAFICQCLYELQAPETCCSFLERINYHLVLSDEHLDPYTCCAVSYVIRQSTNTKVHLDLENSAVSLSGLKIILKHSHYLRDFSTTLSQIWTIALKCEELNYLINLLQLCGNEIHIPMSSQTDVLEQAGKVITRYAEQLNLHLHCDKDPQQLTDLLLSTVFSWLPHISSLNFTPTQGESKEKCQQKCMLFTMDLSLQVFLYQGEDFGKGWKTAKKIMAAICKEPGEFLLDLFSHVKQYESKTHRTVLPALLPVYRSLPVWSIKLSETKVSVLLEVLKLQTQKIPVELRDCSDEESEVRSFLQCLPYISHLSFNETGSKHVKKEHEKRWRTFLLDLCLHAALHQPQTIQETVNTVMTYKYERCEFLLDLFSHVKQYESKTHRTVLPALLPVYRSLPVWSINLSETKVSVLLEVLKLQTQKIPVEVIDCSDEESEVRSFLQCLPYISHFSFNEFDSKHGKKEQEKRWRTFLLDLCLHAALHQPQTIQETVEKVITHKYEQSEFLLDLFSHVKQYESKTHSSVLPALLPVYQSLPVWSINLSERKVSVLLEVLKLQTQKIPVEVIDCSDEESEVRSFLQCLPYISHLRFNGFDSKHGKIEQEKRWRTFLLDLCLHAALHQPQTIQETVEKVMTHKYERCEFLLDLFSHVKQYESKTHRTVLPALLPVYQSLPVWSINLSERKVSDLLEVLKLQTQKIPVEVIDCSDEESVVRSFLQCLPYISHFSFNGFDSKHGKKEQEKRWRTFLLDLCLHAALHQPQTIQETVEKVITHKYEQSDFLLDLFSHVKQYESKTHRTVRPALLPVYRSLPVWSINLSERKVSVLLEVLKLQTQKIPVELRDCSGEEREVRSFLHCLPYISHLRFNGTGSKHVKKEHEKRWRTFLLDLCLHAALHQPQTIQETLNTVITYKYEQSDFLLDLFSHVKQYESKTHRTVLPALLPVYRSLPVWSINLSETKVSVLLEVLKLQTQKIPVELRDCSDEEREVRSFLQCLPYISHLSFNETGSKHVKKEHEKRWRTFLLDLCLHAALHQPQTIQESVNTVMTYKYEQSDFLLDLFSHVKQYESKTHRTVLPALLPVYRSLPVWSINLSETKVSVLLEVLKLQTQKKPVELRDCSGEESEVRSFLQCLPYISHLSFNETGSKHVKKEHEKRWRTFLLDLCLHAALHQPQTIQETLNTVMTYKYEQSDFLLDLFSHVKQYESKTHRTVLPALLPVYRSLPVWSINLSETKVSVLLEVLKLQTQKKRVELRNCSDEESEVRSFLQCLPYISHLSFNVTGSKHVKKEHEKRWRTFLLDLCLHAALHQPQTIQETLNSVITHKYEQSDFLLDLFSHVKQYESKTHRTVLPALLPVYRSLPVWSINLSETKVSVLLEVLKLQTQKKPVELRNCSDEEREVRSFLQCLPYISHLSFNGFYSGSVQFMVNLIIAAVDCQSDKGESFTELLVSVCSYNTFPFRQFYGFHEEQSDFLLDLFSHVKQYESKTHRTVLPALLTVYRSLPAVRFNESHFTDGEKKKKWREFLLDLCLQTALHQPQNIQETVEKVMTDIEEYEEDEYEEQSDFLLDLFSHVKQYDSKTHRTVLPALLTVYRSLPVWSINLSERKVSVLLEVLKLQTQKIPVELRDCSDEESEVRSFLQCLPYISHLSFNESNSVSTSVQFMVNLIIAAVDCQSDKGESFTELLVSVCSYNTFPFRQEVYGFHEKRSDFLLDLFSHVKQYESKTHRTVLPVLLPVYRSLPVWYIDLSERNVSDLLEVLKLQTQKMPVELRNCSDEESEVRSFLQCLPYISELRCDSWLIPRLSKAVVAHAEDTELVRAFFAAMDFVLIIDWVLTTRECRAVRKLLNLSDSKLKLTLKPQAISLRGARLLLRHITHLQKLCLSERLVVRMARAVRAGGSFRSSESRWVIQELCLDFNIINPKTFRYLSSLSSLLNLWTVHCVNLTEYRMEAHSLLSLMCHPGLFKIRLSKWTLQQFTDLLYEAQDEELTRFFLEKVGGDLTSCSLSWEELIYLLQQRVCCISVNIRKNKITHKHTREILPLLSEIQFKRLNPSVLLSFIREIYETDSAHYVSSLLKSTHSCINLNNRDLDSYHCTALCFTLQHCTSVSLSLMWTSIPDGGLVKILPLFNRLSQLSVDRFLLLKLLHCCSISELQQGAAAAVFSALQNRLDFSCSTGLDLSTETQDKTLHLSTEDCRDISTAIQKSQQRTELILEDCELEDTGVDVFLLILHTVRLRCSKSLLLRFLALLRVVNQSDCVMNVMSLSKALNGDMDLSDTPLDLCACKSLALFLEFSEGLSELDLSHCKLTDQGLELLLPHLHKVEVLDLSHNDIDDCLAGRIYTAVSTTSNTQTVRLFNNRITDKEPFQKDKRFEIW